MSFEAIRRQTHVIYFMVRELRQQKRFALKGCNYKCHFFISELEPKKKPKLFLLQCLTLGIDNSSQIC